MITINLLPIGEFRDQLNGKIYLAAVGLYVLVLACGLFSFKTFVMDGALQSLQEESQNLQNTLNGLKKQVATATDITTDTFRQWKQLAAIVNLEERRRDQTRLLVEIDKLVPKTNAWLLSLKHEKGAVVLEGISTDKDTVSEFHTRLENAEYILRQSVNLLEITQNTVINGVKLTKFKITANTVFPEPTVMEDGLAEFGLPSQETFIKVVGNAAPDLVKNITTNATKSGKAL